MAASAVAAEMLVPGASPAVEPPPPLPEPAPAGAAPPAGDPSEPDVPPASALAPAFPGSIMLSPAIAARFSEPPEVVPTSQAASTASAPNPSAARQR